VALPQTNALRDNLENNTNQTFAMGNSPWGSHSALMDWR
jgi:hypothetical protein